MTFIHDASRRHLLFEGMLPGWRLRLIASTFKLIADGWGTEGGGARKPMPLSFSSVGWLSIRFHTQPVGDSLWLSSKCSEKSGTGTSYFRMWKYLTKCLYDRHLEVTRGSEQGVDDSTVSQCCTALSCSRRIVMPPASKWKSWWTQYYFQICT